MKNLEIARAFDLIADLLELKGENPFRAGLADLMDVPGVGPKTAKLLHDRPPGLRVGLISPSERAGSDWMPAQRSWSTGSGVSPTAAATAG